MVHRGVDMKAVSIKQPWANMIASNLKRIETRKWPTTYRGRILIVSSKKHDVDALDYFTEVIDTTKMEIEAGVQIETGAAMRAVLIEKAIGDGKNPAGKALAVADLVDCRKMNRGDECDALCGVYDGVFAWILKNIRKVEPVDVKGALRIYNCPLEEDDLIFV